MWITLFVGVIYLCYMEDLIEYKLVKEGSSSIIVELYYRNFLLARVKYVSAMFAEGYYLIWQIDMGLAPYFSLSKVGVCRLTNDYMLLRGYNLTD